MARIDKGSGFGNLPPWLAVWNCAFCHAISPVEEWEIKIIQVNATDIAGRKCPKCEWVACQVGDTQRMLEQDTNAMQKIKERSMNEEEKAKEENKKAEEAKPKEAEVEAEVLPEEVKAEAKAEGEKAAEEVVAEEKKAE